MCRVLAVSSSGYYSWRKRPVSDREKANQRLLAEIRKIHQECGETYGSPRMYHELRGRGYQCSLNRVARLMRQDEIKAKQGQIKRKRTTQANPDHPVAPNRLNQEFQAQNPNEKWVTDITYIATQEGWLYLAVVLDLFSRKIVGWAIDKTISSDLAQEALNIAYRQRRPEPGLLHHSDRGSQYTAEVYQDLLDKFQMQVSMSRRVNCYDNAPMESFFGSLKTEWLDQVVFPSRAEARREIFIYLEIFYNQRRRHSSLGYLSPEAFEQAYYSSLN